MPDPSHSPHRPTNRPHAPLERWTRRLAVPAFVLYALALATATHWPRLALPPGPIERPDLLVHLAVFALWTLLLWHTGWLGPCRHAASAGRAGGIALAYAMLDESTQSIPGVHRYSVLDDLAANLLGVLVGTLLAVAGSSWLRTRS